MAIDIREGDVLTLDGKDYPVKSAAKWPSQIAAWVSLQLIARKRASTKRTPPVTGGQRGPAVVYLVNVPVTAPLPADPELKQRLALNTPHKLLELFAVDEDETIHIVLEDLQ